MHPVRLSPFRITRYPVTNAQYRRFVEEAGKTPPRHWDDGEIPHGKENHPVVYVSWNDAEAYCTWLTRRVAAGTGGTVRLPTEAQWEYAARKTDSRLYPWGNDDPTDEHANFEKKVGDTTPVDRYPDGATPEGVYDLAGNVWEWCADWYGPYPDHEMPPDPGGPESGSGRVLRGGSFNYGAHNLPAAYRMYNPPENDLDNVGFRVVWLSPGGQD